MKNVKRQIKITKVILLISLILLLTGCFKKSAKRSFLAANYPRIYFISDREGNWDVFRMYADGTSQKNLTKNKADDMFPALSPDGRRIVFTSWRDGNQEIYVMNADGSNLNNLTKNKADDFTPSFSPDGKQIAFSSGRSGTWAMYLMNSDGSNVKRLTSYRERETGPVHWSEDGNTLMFRARVFKPSVHWEVVLINRDGKNRRKLSPGKMGEEDMDFSPAAERVVMSAADENNNWHIFQVNTNGTGYKQLSDGKVECYRPDFSSDGKKIIYTRAEEHQWNLWLLKEGGPKNGIRLTSREFQSGAEWSFDDKKIIFSSQINGTSDADIYIMNADGSNKKRLTTSSGTDWNPRWFPR